MQFKTKFKLLFPHSLTAIRIILAPFLILAGLMKNKFAFFILLILSIISDFLDDYFAEKWYVKTDFSNKLDLVGDKVFELGACIGLIPFYKYSIFLLLINIGIIWINLYRFQKNISFQKDELGKYKTILLWLTLLLASIHLVVPKITFLVNGLYFTSINLILIYFIKQVGLLKQEIYHSSLTPLERNKSHQKIMDEDTKKIKNLKDLSH